MIVIIALFSDCFRFLSNPNETTQKQDFQYFFKKLFLMIRSYLLNQNTLFMELSYSEFTKFIERNFSSCPSNSVFTSSVMLEKIGNAFFTVH